MFFQITKEMKALINRIKNYVLKIPLIEKNMKYFDINIELNLG
jgi:hypothetical protein